MDVSGYRRYLLGLLETYPFPESALYLCATLICITKGHQLERIMALLFLIAVAYCLLLYNYKAYVLV